jgi:DNA-binding transcriptional LysR family regulator
MERAIASRTRPADSVEIRQLRVFLMLAELGRITSVARALGLAQSTVSETLAALERRLGAAVIVRRRGNADAALLTSVGRTLLPHARRILAAVERAQAAVARAVSATRTHVDIAANESVSTYLLPQALSSVRKHWPQTRFTVRIASNADVCECVLRDGLDMGLLLERAHRCGTGDQFARGIASARNRIVVKDIRLAVFASASHPLRVARSSMAPFVDSNGTVSSA